MKSKEQLVRDLIYLWKLILLMTVIFIVLILLLTFTGCVKEKRYYENGQLQYERDGCIDWSDGKEINIIKVSGK